MCFQMRVAEEETEVDVMVGVGMNMNSVLMGEEGFDAVAMVGNAIDVQVVGMVLDGDDQVLVHMVMGLSGGLAVVVVVILELCILVGVVEEEGEDDMAHWVVDDDDTLLVEGGTESPDAREMAEGKVCISPLVVEVELLAAPLRDKEVEVAFYVRSAVGNTQPEVAAVVALID